MKNQKEKMLWKRKICHKMSLKMNTFCFAVMKQEVKRLLNSK